MLNTVQAMTGTQIQDADGDVEQPIPIAEEEMNANGDVEPEQQTKAEEAEQERPKQENIIICNKLKTTRKRRQQGKQMTVPLVGHNLIRHFPKELECDVCRDGKPQRAHCREKVQGGPGNLPEPKDLMDGVTIETKVLLGNKA